MTSQHRPLMGLALVGNPGAGKSTILNGIAGEKAFKSGVSIGTGLTTTLNRYESNDVVLFDTPGLADIQKKKEAGQELDRMLSLNMPVKIAFVVTLEHGRVRPDDATTIDLVLRAIQSVDTDNKFGVIINQVSSGVAKALTDSTEQTAILRAQITGSRRTSHWCIVLERNELKDAKNGMLMTPELTKFFACLPETKPRDAVVTPIDTADLQEKVEAQSLRILELQAASDQTKQALVEKLRKEKKEARARQKMLRNHIESLQLAKDIFEGFAGILKGHIGDLISKKPS